MIKTHSDFVSLDIDLWEEASKPTHGSQDASLVVAQPGALRVAVMDGCTPSRRTQTFASMDGAAYAAEIVRGCLKTVRSIDDAVREANTLLFETAPHLKYRSRPMAGYTACDIDLDSQLVTKASGTGDCEIWVNGQRVYGGVYVTSETVAELKERNIGVTDLLEHIDIEEEVCSAPGALVNPMIGAFETAKVNTVRVDGWDEIVLASDGARLDAERVARLDNWMTELREWEQAKIDAGQHEVKPFDDVTVIRVRK